MFGNNTNNQGVSPVIGVILMVAITVILAAVIAVFVLNVGSDIEGTVNASVTIDEVENGVQVELIQNQSAAEVLVIYDGSELTTLTTVGESYTIQGVNQGDSVTVVGVGEDGQRQTLLSYTGDQTITPSSITLDTGSEFKAYADFDKDGATCEDILYKDFGLKACEEYSIETGVVQYGTDTLTIDSTPTQVTYDVASFSGDSFGDEDLNIEVYNDNGNLVKETTVTSTGQGTIDLTSGTSNPVTNTISIDIIWDNNRDDGAVSNIADFDLIRVS